MADGTDSCHVASAGDPDVAGLGVRTQSVSVIILPKTLRLILTGHYRISGIDLRHSRGRFAFVYVGVAAT
jgi:hypothetical protein